MRLFFLFLFVILPLHESFAGSIYTVGNVLIYASGENATEARNKAVDTGEMKALNQLLGKMATSSAHKPLPNISDSDLARAVQGFQVSDEKIAANHYQAILTVSFNPSVTRAFLSKAGIPFSESNAVRTLLLPVYTEKDLTLFWEPTNHLREELAKRITSSNNNHFILPLGDLDDIATIDKDALKTIDTSKLTKLAAKYLADNVMIVTAYATPEKHQIHLVKAVYEGNNPPQLTEKDISASNGQDSATLLTLVSYDIIPSVAIATPSKTETIEEAEEEHPVSEPTGPTIAVTIPFTELREWTAVRMLLEKNPSIIRVNVKTLSTHETEASLIYSGTSEALLQSIKQQGIEIQKNGEQIMLLRTGG